MRKSDGILSRNQDFRHFLERYRREHSEDVLVVEDSVSADQGVTALVKELWAHGRAPLVVCTNVQGLSCPVVTNMFASRERIARLLGTDVEHLHSQFATASTRRIPSTTVDDGPVLEVRQRGNDIDLNQLPMLKHFAEDRCPYLTSAIVIAQNPRTGVGNASYHRAMVISETRLSTSLHSRGDLWRYLALAAENSQALPVAVVIGGHPLFMLASAARVGIDIDEREIAGGLFGESLELVGTPEYGIGVPATAEIVLEGVIDATEKADEGPFGEYSGYASARSTNNVIQVSTVLRRREPLLVDVVSGNAADHLNLGRVPRESDIAVKLFDRFPDVRSIEYPSSGTHFHCYVSVRATLPHVARQVALALLGWDPYLKLVVVVDDDIDVRHEEDVLWAIATRFQADRDMFVIPHLPGSLLDPSSKDGLTARLAIDATRGPEFDAPRISISEQTSMRAREILGGSSFG